MENLPASIGGGRPVAAGVRRAQALTGLGINSDGFDLADPWTLGIYGIAAAFEVFFEFVRQGRLSEHIVREPLLMEARGVDGGLRVHSEAHPVEDGEQRSGDDARAAGRTGDKAEFAVTQQN